MGPPKHPLHRRGGPTPGYSNPGCLQRQGERNGWRSNDASLHHFAISSPRKTFPHYQEDKEKIIQFQMNQIIVKITRTERIQVLLRISSANVIMLLTDIKEDIDKHKKNLKCNKKLMSQFQPKTRRLRPDYHRTNNWEHVWIEVVRNEGNYSNQQHFQKEGEIGV
ncbi:hypothetical protein BDA99DRAFT_541631 [Phascolomyces articulosus]|uniref:Uncharacterized protein n=1 Tax=Phascolomyces articulosus TaxID=60185 RepID=A0AAD5JRH7_9FUNG|nr:hypothetical protein BDA99DRAFT_541631 [Phascolomyces articulosus]